MNYDAQQYAFSHGLATTPQLHLQQHQQQQQLQQQHQLRQQQQQHFQQQQIFQQQYNQAVPTSSVYQFQFAGGGNPVNPIFQQKEAHQIGISGGIQPRMAQQSMVPQPFLKQGVPVGIDGSSIHVVSSLDGMIYSQQKNNLKIIANPDGRIMQQPDGTVRMQQALVGVDMLGNSNFIEQSLDVQHNQHQGIGVAGQGIGVSGQGNMFAYNKQHFSGWLQPQQMNSPGNAQRGSGCQSSLPSFNHVWSQFQHPQKQVDVVPQQQHQHVNQYQPSQQFQSQLHPQQQQPMQTPQQFAAPGIQTLPSIQMIKMQQHQKPQPVPVPVSMQTLSHLPQQLNCFSPPQPNLMSPNGLDKETPASDGGISNTERVVPISSQPVHPLSCSQPVSSNVEHQPTTAVTYSISGPPKVTVTLDSLTQSDTFPPNQFPGRSEASFNPTPASPNVSKGKGVKPSSDLASPVLTEACPPHSQREWQTSQPQRNPCLPKPLMHTSSTGSSLERSSSESSNFSSPPYTFTPPSSTDSMFSPVRTQFPKSVQENSNSTGRTSAVSVSSTLPLPPSPSAVSTSSQSVNHTITTCPAPATAAAAVVSAYASSVSSTCTTSVTSVVSSCNSMAITTTTVTSTSPCCKESTSIASVHSGLPLSSTSGSTSENHNLSCSPACRLPASTPGTIGDRKVKVPYSWQRKMDNGIIVYLSPSGVVLESYDQICRYLLSDSTCKCGLECPIQVEKFFSFDPEVGSQPWSASSSGEDLVNLCNHRREILALAAFHSSQAEAAESSADHNVQLGKKRERKKSIGAGEGLIVAPLKRLKTSITNAVNKHALSAGSSAQPHTPTAVDSVTIKEEKPQILNTDLPFPNPIRRASVSPANSQGTQGSCSNHGDLSGQTSPMGTPIPGRSDYQRSGFGMDGGEEKVAPGSVPLQHFASGGEQDGGKQAFRLSQQYQAGRGTPHGNPGSQVFMQMGGSFMYHQGSGGESGTGMQNLYPVGMVSHTNHQIQYPQSELPHHPHQQPSPSANPSIFFPQNHMYPNMPHMTQQRPQGFHSAMWQSGGSNTNGPTSLPHPHHHTPPRSYPPGAGFHHANFNHTPPGPFPKHSTPNPQQSGNGSWLDPTKTKSKRPKSKKDKQKQNNSIVDRSSPCTKALTKPAKAAAIPSTTVSFFENPTVFVEQQTAIINNSIASCQIACSSPSPPQSSAAKSIATYPPLKDTAFDSRELKSRDNTGSVGSESLEELDKNEIIDKEEDEDQKTGTDLDSNKSFSDTTENNDSAYLSQTGSDQERSDTIDGSDSCLETKSKSSDIYDFNSSEERETKQGSDVIHIDTKSLEPSASIADVAITATSIATSNVKSIQECNTVSAKIPNTAVKAQDKKTAKSKPKQKPTLTAKKEAGLHDVELLKKSLPGSLNGDLSQLLASNNWNIPALQQVLAQYSGGDPGQLNAAIQAIQSQVSGADANFPASNLLCAAARAQVKQKEQVAVSLPNGLNTHGLQNAKSDMLQAVNVSSAAVNDVKPVVSTSSCGPVVSSVMAQPQAQPSFQQVGNSTGLLGNMMQLQQLPSGNFAMNMLLPASGQGQTFTSDSTHTGTLNTDADLKTAVSGHGALNPLVAQSILATVSQSPDVASQLKLSVASVIPSSLGPGVAQCTPDGSTMLLNNFGPRMIMNAPMPPVSVSVVTNVTKSLAQVVPTIGINQTVFGTQQVASQLLSAQQNGPQIINTAAAPAGTHVINTSPQGAQLVGTGPQRTQFVNPAPQGSQLVNNTQQATQIMNALSVQGLNNQLLITNPIQQVSPSNSISQLSPAMAAQILAQGHQQLQQMSPSFLPNQIQKQTPNSVISSQNIFASVSLPALTVTSNNTEVIVSSISQTGVISSNIQKNARAGDSLDKVDLANNITQVKDTNSSIANASMYASTSQPVIVIPQPNTNPMMQVLGSAQPLSSASGLPADLNMQQGNLSQLFGHSAAVDQSQLQNLFTPGFNPLTIQHMMNTVSLSGVQQQQQQQQLQMLQLQQLMQLQQLQNQGQNIQGISLPLNQNASPSQAASLGAQTIMNAVMPQQGLQLNSVMDMNTLHPCLSPVAQGYQNQLSPAAAQLQHISSALTVHQVASGNTCATVGVIQNSGGMTNLMQAPAKSLPAGPTVQSQQLPADQVIQTHQTTAVNPSVVTPQEPPKTSAIHIQPSVAGNPKSPVVGAVTKPSQPSKSKSKSKSKKSECKKPVDLEAERNEEDIAATVHQILAQAVQQQKELSLAAKNQPPPPPKSKSKKSSARSKANQAVKEHDLGKLPSISDDAATIASSEVIISRDKPAFEVPAKCSELVEVPVHFPPAVSKSSHSDSNSRQSVAISPSNHIKLPVSAGAPPSSLTFNGLGTGAPAATSFVEQTLNETTNLVNSNTKKSAISLKDHLSSIISKDSSKKKSSGGSSQKQGKGKAGIDQKMNHVTQPTTLINEVPAPSRAQKKSVK